MKKPLEWEKEFVNNCRNNVPARRVWKEIVDTQIDRECKMLLYWYAEAMGPTIEAVRKGARLESRKLKAACRADQVAKSKAHGSRAHLFISRRDEAITEAAKTPWPFNNPNVKTLKDAASAYPLIGALSLEEARHLSAKSAESTRRWGSKPLLLVLRDYAAKHGVKVGLKRLYSLAACASPDRSEDPSNLSRFFNCPEMKLAAPLYLQAFEDFLISENFFVS